MQAECCTLASSSQRLRLCDLRALYASSSEPPCLFGPPPQREAAVCFGVRTGGKCLVPILVKAF
jgi:hypothetical protein